MKPVPIITCLSLVLKLCSATPVYNMQPAFITTHIGTTGRNIRNLPCVSRKTNEKGICMFAINCLKANGTHLGTCIDKFYFGSCCQLPTISEIDNSIDTDIIPSREPPHRLSTLRPLTTTLIYSNTTEKNTTTVSEKTTVSPTKDEKTTTEYKLSTEFNIRNLTRLPSVAETSDPETTTVAQKLTTFLSINGSPSTTEFLETTTKAVTKTAKPTTTKNTIKTTPKPTTTQTTKSSSKPVKVTSRPRPTTSTAKPVKTTKPTKAPSKRPVVTVKVPVATKKPSTTTKSTRRPIVTTTRKSTTTTSTKRTTTTKKVTTAEATTITTTTPKVTQSFVSSISTSSPATVGEQITSNEIPLDVFEPIKNSTPSAVTTQSPSFVTWTVDETTLKKNISDETRPTTEDWKPITTADGWVLLASVPPPVSDSTSEAGSVITFPPKNNSTAFTSEEPTGSFITANLTTSSPPTPSTVETTSSPSATSSSTETTPSTQGNLEDNSTIYSTDKTPAVETTTTEKTAMNESDFTSVCGRRMYPEARIVGGEKTPFGKWPWQISLRQWRTSTFLHKCGAALLNENWAITAAHCVDNVPPSDLLLRLGEHDLSTDSEPYLHQERRVQIVASHPQFDPRTFEYDLALLRFYEPVTFQPNIIPVCVPQTDENFVGRTAFVTGWGRLYEDGPLPSVLQEVSVPVINNSVCESMYRSAGYIEHIPHIFICAGWRRGGYDSCEGDSGGPMVIQRDDKRFLLAGVISWGIGCAEPNQPGVYTRISEFRDWINQILQF